MCACGVRWSVGWHVCRAETQPLFNFPDRSERFPTFPLEDWEWMRGFVGIWVGCSYSWDSLPWQCDISREAVSVNFREALFSLLLFPLQMALWQLSEDSHAPHYFILYFCSNLLTLYNSFLCHSRSCLLWLVFFLTHRREVRTFQWR